MPVSATVIATVSSFRTPVTSCTGYLEHPFKTRHVEAEKDLLPLFANTGEFVYTLKSSPASSSSHNDIFT